MPLQFKAPAATTERALVEAVKRGQHGAAAVLADFREEHGIKTPVPDRRTLARLPLERVAVVRALADTAGDVGRAAYKLRCSRRTLQSRMRDFDLPPGRSGRKRRVLPFSQSWVHRIGNNLGGWGKAALVAGSFVAGGLVVHRLASK